MIMITGKIILLLRKAEQFPSDRLLTGYTPLTGKREVETSLRSSQKGLYKLDQMCNWTPAVASRVTAGGGRWGLLSTLRRNNRFIPGIRCLLRQPRYQRVEGKANLKFSELNSDSRYLRNCSLPTGSFRTSSMPKPHRFTLCWFGSLLKGNKQTNNPSDLLK